MNTKIEVEVKKNYGASAFYIVSEHKGFIETLTRRKTIDVNDIMALTKLGFQVSEKNIYHKIFDKAKAIHENR